MQYNAWISQPTRRVLLTPGLLEGQGRLLDYLTQFKEGGEWPFIYVRALGFGHEGKVRYLKIFKIVTKLLVGLKFQNGCVAGWHLVGDGNLF